MRPKRKEGQRLASESPNTNRRPSVRKRSPLGDVEEAHEGSSCPDCGRRPGWHDIGEDARVIRHRMHARREKSINDPPPEDGYYKFAQHGIVSKTRVVETLARRRCSGNQQFRRVVDHVPFWT